MVWTITALVLGGFAFYLGVNVMGMDVVSFMVRAPIPFVFGTIIVLNMLHGSLFGKLTQPLKGVLNALASAVIGVVLAQIYGFLAPVVTGAVKPGPPSYDFEIWLASALLAVTFPFLIFYAEFFRMWPLHKEAEEPAAAPSASSPPLAT
jgi:ABC-type antimicrobial peptide transport system permease subunit